MYGISAGIGCNYATQLKFLFGVDDALDIFAVHCIGGVIGNLLTGFLAADYIAALDGFSVIQGGWVNGHWVQLAIQLADSVAGLAYSFVMTSLILLVIGLVGTKVTAMRLRVTDEEEERGIDDVGEYNWFALPSAIDVADTPVELGEFAYDYVELTRDVQAPELLHGQKAEFVTGDGTSSRSDSRVAFGRSQYGRDVSASPPPPHHHRSKEDEFPMTTIKRSPTESPGYFG